MIPPVAHQIPFTRQRPTGDSDDPWTWLEDRDDHETIAYLNAENAYADAWLAPHEPLVETIFEEIRSRVQETDLAAPVRKDGWWYTTRTEEGKSYAIHCRGASRETAMEQVLLDENLEAHERDYFAVGAFEVSPDGRLLAWSSDIDGGERYTLRVRDLSTGSDIGEPIPDTSWGGVAWSGDSSVLFYVKADDAMRPFQVWRHRRGDNPASDELILTETDERLYVSIEASRSGAWIIISASSKQLSEVHLLDANQPFNPAKLMDARREDVEYSVEHWGDHFVILTNDDAEDFRILLAAVDSPEQRRELVAHEPGRRITAAEPFADHLVIHEWQNAQQRIRIVFGDGREQVIDLGDEPHEVEIDANPEYASTTLRYMHQSYTRPASIWDYDIASGTGALLKQTESPGVDFTRYTAHREWATAPDGTLVPVDVVRQVETLAGGDHPCLVYGYGSYEASMAPWYSVGRISLLERGWTFAVVHPRGGGELGRTWYLDGKMLNKRNTFSDTIACTEHLIARGWAGAQRAVIRGGSAGGLLVGACITMRPELFAAAVAEVPFVDVVSTMSNPNLPLTVTEWDEWGDPRHEPYASYMLSYSPYDNVTAASYPAMFVTAGLNDPRVSYYEPAKLVAKMRHLRTDERPLLLRTEMEAGHGGRSGRYDSWREEARLITFLLAVNG